MREGITLRVIALLFVLILGFLEPSFSQVEQETDLPEELGTALGVHKLALEGKDILSDFSEIDYVYFEKLPGIDTADPPTDEEGNVEIAGELKLKSGLVFSYERAFFQRIPNGNYKGITFETIELAGVKFELCGEFLDKKIYNKVSGRYTRIIGKLTKYVHGKKVASQQLQLYEYAEL